MSKLCRLFPLDTFWLAMLGWWCAHLIVHACPTPASRWRSNRTFQLNMSFLTKYYLKITIRPLHSSYMYSDGTAFFTFLVSQCLRLLICEVFYENMYMMTYLILYIIQTRVCEWRGGAIPFLQTMEVLQTYLRVCKNATLNCRCQTSPRCMEWYLRKCQQNSGTSLSKIK